MQGTHGRIFPLSSQGMETLKDKLSLGLVISSSALYLGFMHWLLSKTTLM